MSLIRSILSTAGRLRRSRGFGVHSPYAFHLITKVMREKNTRYYAYSEIDEICPKSRRISIRKFAKHGEISVSEAHMLFRLMCHFNPTKIIQIGNAHEVIKVILKRAVPKADITQWQGKMPPSESSEPLFLINSISANEVQVITQAIESTLKQQNAIVIMRNTRKNENTCALLRNICDTTPFGMAFNNGNLAIFVGRRTLPSQSFYLI